MNALRKRRVGSVLKYTWPVYIVSGVVVVLVLRVIFGVTHRLPNYKTMTIFVSGQVTNNKKLEKDLLSEFKEKELKEFMCYSSDPSSESTYDYTLQLMVNTADIMIIPSTELDSLALKDFAFGLSNEIIDTYYSGFSIYGKEDINYGVKIDKEKVKEYMTLPEEDCYMVFSGQSANVNPSENHDNALLIARNWGM